MSAGAEPREPRRRGLVAALALATALPWTTAARAAEGERGPRTTEVAPGVFAVLQPEAERFNESNSLFVVRAGSLLVVDTQSTLAATRATIAAIRARSELPVRHLVLTHWHGDHVQGVAAYRELWPGVEVIGHVALAGAVRERAEPQLAERIGRWEEAIAAARGRLEQGVDRQGQPLEAAGRQGLAADILGAEEAVAGMRAIPRPLPLPDLFYDGDLVLGAGAEEVRLLGRRAHTAGDTLVYLPATGVLASGDVVDDLPFGGHGYPAHWVELLAELVALEPKVIVPGHGGVRRGGEHLGLLAEMFGELVRQTAAAAGRGLDLEATRATVDLARFRAALAGDDPVASRAWEGFIPPTIERAWLEARGELRD